MNWVLTWEGSRWTLDDLTVGHVYLVNLCNGGQSFDNLDPRTGTERLVAMLAAFITSDRLAKGVDTSVADVLDELVPLPFVRLIAAVSEANDV